jgi:hypothetical protein
MDLFFESFLRERASDFRRISRSSKSQISPEELHGEAWLVAQDICAKRGKEVDFTNLLDQDAIFAKLHVLHVKRADWRFCFAASMDQEDEDEEGGSVNHWSNSISAHPTSDPLELLLLQETMADAESLLTSSYSQAAAYIAVFYAFDHDRQEICAYLVITDVTLMRRVGIAEQTVRVQPSLFDRIEKIGESFMPAPGRAYAMRANEQYSAMQFKWEF